MPDPRANISTIYGSFNSGEDILIRRRKAYEDIQRMLMMSVADRDTSRPKFRTRLIHRLRKNGW